MFLLTIDTKNRAASDDFQFQNIESRLQKYELKERKSKFRKALRCMDMIYLIMSDRFARTLITTATVGNRKRTSNPNRTWYGDIEASSKFRLSQRTWVTAV
jgi:hypothetical protein